MKRWQYILLTVALCAMAFSYGYSVQPGINCITTASHSYYPPNE